MEEKRYREHRYQRRVRYSGTHPKRFEEKYKEQNPEKYADTVEKVIKKGSTGRHAHLDLCERDPGFPGYQTGNAGGLTLHCLRRAQRRC